MTTSPAIETGIRDGAPGALAVLLRGGTPFADAEDAVAEAVEIALDAWPRTGVPDRPAAWFVRVARRRLIARHRTDTARARREAIVGSWSLVPAEPGPTTDDSLALLVLCCHPRLSPTAAIPLTLRAVGGLTTREIAAALLSAEPTVAQRISRAKATLADDPDPFRAPTPDELARRLPSVMQVIYLIFTEGHLAGRRTSGGALDRPDLAHEAVRLARQLHHLLPDEPEVTGLLALLLLTDARRPARSTDDGTLVPLDEQDRRRWDRPMVVEGLRLLTAALGHHRLGPYQLRAAIAGVHDQAPTWAATDWPRLVELYDRLLAVDDTPVVALNRAIALGHAVDPATGLAALDPLAEALADHHRYHAATGYLRALAGDDDGARAAYARAAAGCPNEAERRHLAARAGLGDADTTP